MDRAGDKGKVPLLGLVFSGLGVKAQTSVRVNCICKAHPRAQHKVSSQRPTAALSSRPRGTAAFFLEVIWSL